MATHPGIHLAPPAQAHSSHSQDGSELKTESRLSWDIPSEFSLPPVVSEYKCTTWWSDDDPAQIILTYDIHKIGSYVSDRVYGSLTKSAHQEEAYEVFTNTLRKHKIQVVELVDLIISGRKSPGFEEFMASRITCQFPEEISFQEMKQFKKDLVEDMTVDQMEKAISHQVSVKLSKSDAIQIENFTISPLLDILASRAQIVTPNGVILVSSDLYRAHSQILEYAFSRLGLKTILRLPHPLRMSGNDYIPIRKDLCFFGTGLLTDEASARYIMSKDGFGVPRVALIRDLFDRTPGRACLDNIMRVVSRNCILVLEDVLGYRNINRRLVNEYVREGRKLYTINKMNIELEDYLNREGFTVIKYPHQLYNQHGMGIHNLGNGTLLVSHPDVKAFIEKHSEFEGTIEVVSFRGDFSTYSWISSCSLMFRKPSQESISEHVKDVIVREVAPWGTTSGHRQSTDTVPIVAPVGFRTNEETALDNYFMKTTSHTQDEIERLALQEFSSLTKELSLAGVKIVMFSSERFHNTPDAVFPNNWFSTHAEPEVRESTVVFYPMKTVSRRHERRQNIISELQSAYAREFSFVQWETADFPHFLESTGGLVMDRVRKIAYAALSQRCYSKIATTWANKLGYRLVLFHSTDLQGRPIYHTDVMMSVGTTIAVICLESIEHEEERKNVIDNLSKSHEILPITREQTNEFCGNILEVRGQNGQKIMAMSTRAYDAFTEEQKALMLKHVDQIVHSPIPIIETIGGGGVRCMLGEVF